MGYKPNRITHFENFTYSDLIASKSSSLLLFLVGSVIKVMLVRPMFRVRIEYEDRVSIIKKYLYLCPISTWFAYESALLASCSADVLGVQELIMYNVLCFLCFLLSCRTRI